MYGILLIVHILICILLIIVVLMQQSRGAGMASVFGGSGGTDSLFGGKGATPFFIKLTSGLAIGFFISSLALVLLARRPVSKSAIEKGLESEMPVESGPAIPGEGGPMIPTDTGGGN